MKKRTKILSLLLAGVMAFTPAMETIAVENPNNDEIVELEDELSTEKSEAEPVVENSESATEPTSVSEETESKSVEDATEIESESITGSSETEIEGESTEESSETEIESESVTESSETETTKDGETETEEIVESSETETESVTEETETESVTEETEIETETESVTEETEVETETEEEVVLPGMDNYTLSSEQRDSIRELRDHMDEISGINEGVDCVKGELTFLADTKEEAEKIAAGYGGELQNFAYGVGIVTLPEDVGVVEALEYAASSLERKDIVIVPAWPNYYNYAFTDNDMSYAMAEDSDVSLFAISSDDNDPFLNTASDYYQWQHATVGSYSAWNAGYTGNGIKVAVLDSGVIENHEDLNLVGSQNFVTGASSATDENGHGTHVAGLIAAAKNNGRGGAGIAPDALVMNFRVLDADGGGRTADIMRGIRAAVGSKVDIINMSLGGYYYSGDYATVVKEAYDTGIALFAAAGNDGSSIATYPACYSGAIAVGATAQGNDRTSFSNYGSWVKFYAPGYDLYSTYMDGGYYQMSGTSQATPVVAGTAAVILSANDSLKSKSGKAKVDALVAAMNKGKVSNIVSLPKALGIAVSYETPKAPAFATKTGTTFNKEYEEIVINATSTQNRIYYSVDGKVPTYKNGALSANARRYTEPITVGGAAKVTVSAIEVNPVGLAGPVAKATYNFKPSVSSISIDGSNNLLVGKSTKLTATVWPEYAVNKKVDWNITAPANGGGVTVSNGTVKAAKDAKPGNYTVTVTSKDSNSTARETFTITVKDTATVKKISFKKASDTVFVGEDFVSYNLVDSEPNLDVTLADGTSKGSKADVTWSSSNTSLATVFDGMITAKRPGKVKITAMANDGSGVKGVFNLTIKQYATGIALSGSNMVAVGKTNKLTATVWPSTTANKKLDWSVSPEDEGVTVSNGTVKVAKTAKTGEYTITATAVDRKDGAAYASKKITVSDNAIQKITFSQAKATIYRVRGTQDAPTSVDVNLSIDAKTASGGSASSTAVEFISSNPGIARVTSFNGTTATITATGYVAGSTKITCKALDGSGKSATCTVTVTNPTSKISISAPAGNGGDIAEGCSIKLKANFESQYGKVTDTSVEWSSSNPDIAVVDKKSGVVKAKSKSTPYSESVIITATSKDGAKANFTVYTWKKFNTLKLEPIVYEGKLMDLNEGNFFISPKGELELDYLYDGKRWYEGMYCPYISVEVKDKDILQVVPYYGVTADGIPYGFVNIAATGKKLGSTSFTIKVNDGSNKKVTYKLGVD